MKDIKTLPTSASFLVTEDCNLRCTYCFENHMPNHMTEEVAKAGLEFLCNNALKEGSNSFGVTLFGGEPMTNIKLVEFILRYGTELSRLYDISFDAGIITNATILTPEIADMLKHYVKEIGLHVQLSVDGIQEIQDAYRVTRNGGPSFHMVEKNIPMWKEIFKDNPMSLNIHGCSNKETLPYLYENFMFFSKDWDMKNIWFMPIHSEEWDFEDVAIYENQLNKIADYTISEAIRTNSLDPVMGVAPLDRCFSNGMFSPAPCGAGKNYVTITASGDVFPCHQIYFNDPEHITKIGSVMDGGYIDEGKRKLVLSYGREDMSCAKLNPNCTANGCYICIGENWLQNGSILSTVDVNGVRCLMSQVEKRVQDRIKSVLTDYGLMGQKAYSANLANDLDDDYDSGLDCKCDVRSGLYAKGPVEAKSENTCDDNSCGCGNKDTDHKCSCEEEDEFKEIIAASQMEILKRLDKLEDNYVNKEGN